MFHFRIFQIIMLMVQNKAIWLDPMFQAIQFPASIPDLDTSLTNVNGETLPHDDQQVPLQDRKSVV